MEGLTFRKATPGDTERIADIMHGEPGPEAVAIAGCVEAARAFGVGLVRLPNSPYGWQCSSVAEAEGRVVGVLQTAASSTEIQVTPRLALLALRTFGVGIISVLPRLRARQRVALSPPGETYHISELHVDPRLRGQGIGGALLDFAEQEARAAGFTQMSLATTTSNPARRLYERHSFRVVETRSDRAYERYTGIAGRLLMVKELS